MLNLKSALPVLSMLALAASCSDDVGSDAANVWDDPAGGPEGRWPGQTEFESAAPWSRIFHPFMRGLADGSVLEGTQAQRAVEEADIVKVSGSRAFILNPYRGLMAVDIANADQPRIRGRLKLQGQPQEMHLKGNIAFVMMNGVYTWGDSQNYRSSLLVVDVSDMTSPELIDEYELEGNILESRIVGDALYVVSDAWDYDKQESTTHVLSLDIAQPASANEVQRVSFPGNGHVIHATNEYLFVAKYNYPGTTIQVIDISDAGGNMQVGNEVTLPGYVQDRFMMDYTGGHLRVVSHQWDDGGHILVDTYALNSASTTLSARGHLDLADIGSLTAARFDGDRVYLVHQIQVDPLDVVDLSTPAAPALLDRIEIPGWLERLEVQNDRIVGVGFDVAGTPAPAKVCPGYTYEPLASGRKLSVALYDVSDTGDVCEAGRVRFGTGEWAWSNGFYDDKALKFLSAENLLLVPFSESTQNGYFTGVQMVDVDLTALSVAARGVVQNATQVDRSFLAQDRLMVLGSRALTVANIDNRDAPVVTSNLELSRNVVAFEPVGSAGYGVQLVGDAEEPGELRVVSLDNADANRDDAVATISVEAPAGEMYVSGNIVTVFSRSYTEDGPRARMTNFDLKTPTAPKKLGTLELPIGYGYDVRPFMMRRFMPTSDIVRVQDHLFVVSAPETEGTRYSLIDNKKPGSPKISYEHVKPNDKTVVLDLKAWWGDLYVVSYTPVATETAPVGEGDHALALDRGQSPDVASMVMPLPPDHATQSRVKYWVSRVTFSKSGKPTIGAPVNTPGRLVDVSQDGKIWTLLDNRWEAGENGAQQKKELFTVKLKNGKAPLLDGILLREGVEDVKVRGKAAYYTEMWSDWSGPVVPLAETVEAGQEIIAPEPKNEFNLVILNWSDPAQIRQSSSTVIADDGSSGNLQDVRQVDKNRFAFISMGWGGMSVFDVTSSKNPFLREFVRSNAWRSSLTVSPANEAAFMAGGDYGVETIDLSE